MFGTPLSATTVGALSDLRWLWRKMVRMELSGSK
ncbi:MAG: hypothetical protein QOH03_1543, partial [Kribbellaceae bacterium]|nr:hypothetical protein [Kribbellaceae bacterium]